MGPRDRVELYTCKLDTMIRKGSAEAAVVVTAQRGSVEDVNALLNDVAAALRALYETPPAE